MGSVFRQFLAMTETPEDWKARETTSRYHFPRHDITCRYDICHEYAGNSKERPKRDWMKALAAAVKETLLNFCDVEIKIRSRPTSESDSLT